MFPPLSLIFFNKVSIDFFFFLFFFGGAMSYVYNKSVFRYSNQNKLPRDFDKPPFFILSLKKKKKKGHKRESIAIAYNNTRYLYRGFFLKKNLNALVS